MGKIGRESNMEKRFQGDTDMKVNILVLCAENPFSLTGHDVGPSARQQNAHSAQCLHTSRCL